MTDAIHDKYKVSVIIPVYNQEDSLESGVLSLKNQGVDFCDIQVLLVDDGSTDRSPYICDKLCKEYSNILCIHQKNSGVSLARNTGIRHAEGKYMVFLDADDMLADMTIRNLIDFYDLLDDDVDLITYPIETYFDGKRVAPHFRYKVLTHNGVYSLKDYAFIGQTTMNIVVKNRFEKNILFDVNQTFSEDQKYCCDVLGRTLKMGFCKDGTYIYFRSHQSASGRMSGSCYIFEQCTRFFEDLFARYEEVPLAFQGLFVNDFYWKLVSGILLPYHYSADDYKKAWDRLMVLLGKCGNEVILNHPAIDGFEKYYLLRIKPDNGIRYYFSDGKCLLLDGHKKILYERSIEAVITKISKVDGRVHIDGFLKSVFFQFYDESVTMFALENCEVERELKLSFSSHNYYRTHEKTQKFKSFRYSCNPEDVSDLQLYVGFGQYRMPIRYYFMPLTPLSHLNNQFECIKGNTKISLKKDGHFNFKQQKNRKKDNIWLYYDCAGVVEDNGHLQFEHDITIDDGVSRYYIVTDYRQKKNPIPDRYYVEFGSKKHKKLLKKCSKILTAFIEQENILPFDHYQIESEANEFDFEVIYLQHGVLHAVMPWKYTREKLMADRVVVSTYDESSLWIKNGFDSNQLIKTGMPRMELLRKVHNRKRILYAPSWRQFLVGYYIDHKWQPMEKKFLSSEFYKQSISFLQSRDLRELLEKNDYKLDVQLHPIFKQYEKYYNWESDRIAFRDNETTDGEYSLMITDYSSYEYNFHYLSIPVIHFMPDETEFRCGMNGYRELYPDNKRIFKASNAGEIIRFLSDNIKDFEKINNCSIKFYNSENVRNDIYNAVCCSNS